MTHIYLVVEDIFAWNWSQRSDLSEECHYTTEDRQRLFIPVFSPTLLKALYLFIFIYFVGNYTSTKFKGQIETQSRAAAAQWATTVGQPNLYSF